VGSAGIVIMLSSKMELEKLNNRRIKMEEITKTNSKLREAGNNLFLNEQGELFAVLTCMGKLKLVKLSKQL
jgi:hypothetical protein